MFRIGEFSKFARVSPRMLRYYDKCGLLKPAETDKFTGYRLYGARQIADLNRILYLRDAGFSVEEISAVLSNIGDSGFMKTALSEKLSQIKLSISAEKRKAEIIQIMLNDLEEEKLVMDYNVVVKEIPSVNVFSLREIIPDYSREGDLWGKMWGFIYANGLKISTDEQYISIYHDEEYRETDVDVEILLAAEKIDGISLPEGFSFKTLERIPAAATLKFAGAYENTSKAMEELGRWAEENGYDFVTGEVRGSGIRHPGNEQNPENYLTEIQIPVRKR